MDFLLLSDVLILPLPFLQITNRWSNIWICDTVLSVAHWLSCFMFLDLLNFIFWVVLYSFICREAQWPWWILVPSTRKSIIRNWHRNLSQKLWFCKGPCHLPMFKIHFLYIFSQMIPLMKYFFNGLYNHKVVPTWKWKHLSFVINILSKMAIQWPRPKKT